MTAIFILFQEYLKQKNQWRNANKERFHWFYET